MMGFPRTGDSKYNENSFNTTMMASFLLSNSEQKEQTNKEKYAFYYSVSQIHINPEKKQEKNTEMIFSDEPN